MCFPPCSADPGVKGWLLPREVLRTNPSPVLDGNDFFFFKKEKESEQWKGAGKGRRRGRES